MKINAAILEAPVIECTLTHLGLYVRDPPRAPARSRSSELASAASLRA